jgi:GNAT superfamily N-acetyltransferase
MANQQKEREIAAAKKKAAREAKGREKKQAALDEELFYAAMTGRMPDIQNLIAQGAVGAHRNANGETALIRMQSMGDLPEATEALIRVSDPKARTDSGEDALMRAAAFGRDKAVAVLLGVCDPKASDDSGETALMHGLRSAFESFESLRSLAAVSNLLAVEENGMTPLMFAAGAGHKEASRIEMLLEAGAAQTLNDRDEEGSAALHHAARAGSETAMGALLDAGADPLALDGQGRRPSEAGREHCRGRGIARLLMEEAKHLAARERDALTEAIEAQQPGADASAASSVEATERSTSQSEKTKEEKSAPIRRPKAL